MKSTNTFGVHYILRQNRPVDGKFPVYVRITVNKSRCELALTSYLLKEDWNIAKGAAKPTNQDLKELNSCIEYYPTGTGAVMKELGEGSRDMTVTMTGWDLNPRILGIVPKS